MIKQLILIGLLSQIVVVQAMDLGAAAHGPAKVQRASAPHVKSGAAEEQKVRSFIALIQEFTSPNSRPQLKEQMRKALAEGVDLNLTITVFTEMGMQSASINKAINELFVMRDQLRLRAKEIGTQRLLEAARTSGELAAMASQMGASIEQVEEVLEGWQKAVDGGLLELIDQLEALLNEHKASLLINVDLTDDEMSPIPNPTEGAVSFESVETLTDAVSQFIETNDSYYKDEIARALANGADRELVVQAVAKQEAKFQRLTLDWEEFQATRPAELESRVTRIMVQEKELNREKALELLKGEYTRSQTFIQGDAAARVHQLKELLEGKNQINGTGLTTESTPDVTIPESTNKKDERDAKPGSNDAPSKGGWSSWFSYKKAVLAVGVAITVAVVGKKVYDERNKKDTRIV